MKISLKSRRKSIASGAFPFNDMMRLKEATEGAAPSERSATRGSFQEAIMAVTCFSSRNTLVSSTVWTYVANAGEHVSLLQMENAPEDANTVAWGHMT